MKKILKDKILVTGGLGFIGRELVKKLVAKGEKVKVFDLKSSPEQRSAENLEYIQGNLLSETDIGVAMEGIGEVYHLAASSEVRSGEVSPKLQIEQNLFATSSLLEAMRKEDVKKICFTSSSTVYGEAKEMPTSEHSDLKPISIYGATKLASELLISSYCETFGMKSVILRLANIIGHSNTHGVIYDFINKLKENPDRLEILGDGNQCKSYLHVSDCIEAMLIAVDRSKERISIFNIGSEDQITIKAIAKMVCERLKVNPRLEFTWGRGGWKGDVPNMLLDINRMKKLVWKPRLNSEQAVREVLKHF